VNAIGAARRNADSIIIAIDEIAYLIVTAIDVQIAGVANIAIIVTGSSTSVGTAGLRTAIRNTRANTARVPAPTATNSPGVGSTPWIPTNTNTLRLVEPVFDPELANQTRLALVV